RLLDHTERPHPFRIYDQSSDGRHRFLSDSPCRSGPRSARKGRHGTETRTTPYQGVEDKKAVGGRHKQPGRLAVVSWATIRRIYDIAHAALWALAVATVVNMIINIPQISEARRRAELQRVQEISEENRFYCTKWGLRANTHEHLICMMDLDAIR